MSKLYRLKKNVMLYVIFLCCLLPVWAEGNREANWKITGRLKYAFIMLQEKQPILIIDQVITREMLKNKLILYYKPISNAYLYIYALNPGKEFRLLRPISFNIFNKYSYFYQPEYIYFPNPDQLLPETDCWEIHLVISTKRLPEVEKLITDLTKITPEKDTLIELTNKLHREIQNLKVKKILGYDTVELPESVNSPFRELLNPIISPFDANEGIEIWLDTNTIPIEFTHIYEGIYYFYECEAEH